MIKKIVVLGAGISGLTIAWLLQNKFKQAVNITILEKLSHTGGMIQSEKISDFVLETGPNAFIPRGKGEKTLLLIKEIGLEDQLIPSSTLSQARYFHYQGKIRKLGLPLLLQTGLFRSIVKDLLCKKQDCNDELLKDLLLRHSSEKFIENILSPMLMALKAGHIDTLSSFSTLPLLKNWERHYGSFIMGALKNLKTIKCKSKNHSKTPYLFSLKHGMGSLIDCLTRHLQESIKLDFPITKLVFNDAQQTLICSPKGNLRADLVISCIPIKELKGLITTNIPLIEELSKHIADNYLTCIAMGWDQPALLKKRGYGMLVSHDPQILGFLWNSDIFPEKYPGKSQISVLMSGKRNIENALCGLSRYLKVNNSPKVISNSQITYAIPQQMPGFMEILRKEKGIPKQLILSGQSITGPGVNSCISHAHQLVDSLTGF